MKIIFIIFILVSSALAAIYFDLQFAPVREDIHIQSTGQDLLADTNHNWSNK